MIEDLNPSRRPSLSGRRPSLSRVAGSVRSLNLGGDDLTSTLSLSADPDADDREGSGALHFASQAAAAAEERSRSSWWRRVHCTIRTPHFRVAFFSYVATFVFTVLIVGIITDWAGFRGVFRFNSSSTPESPTDGGNEGGVASSEVVTLPDALNSLAEVEEPPLGNHFWNHDIPLFWAVPLSGGVVERVMGHCWDLVLATRHGHSVADGSTNATGEGKSRNVFSETLRIIEFEGARYVNVDTVTPEGIRHAHSLGLLSSGLADVIVSPYIHFAASTLFSAAHRGRAFTMIRHPIERATALYRYFRSHTEIAKADGAGAVSVMSLEQYSRSSYAEGDWMTRFLADKMTGPLNDTHLALAKEALRAKVLVGLYEQMDDSLDRFERYFGWGAGNAGGILVHSQKQKQCRADSMATETAWETELPSTSTGDENAPLEIDDAALMGLQEKNRFDLELYNYAKVLFDEQLELFDESDGGQ